MKRLLPLLLLLAGCASTPVATAPSTTTTTTTTETTVVTTSPRIDTPSKLPADPCLMLTAADFQTPLAGPPGPHPELPRSCAWQEGTGAESDMLVLVAFADAYEKPEKAPEMLIQGHSAAVSFNTGPGVMECTYLVAVNATESFKVIVSLPNANSAQVSQIALGKAKTAFKRLVAA
ncbi:DUF3558 domain-containing protein [Lentzea californiensis]|uniref:DUF3558 domain-containing protein n=1 Tax=Lentzea californiensis TaxID=438851 RepID=UPI0021644157|nr:DUF3558 domain-containing protein [Lentzea californiensis]MCR3746090.1 Protein of unknown function (DUF3558) [Lentzea californiensis]